MDKFICCLIGITVLVLFASGASAVVIDGTIGGGEGWTLFTENPDAGPVAGGSTTQSDDFTESSAYHWWDGTDHGFTTGPRGGVNNIYPTFPRCASHVGGSEI